MRREVRSNSLLSFVECFSRWVFLVDMIYVAKLSVAYII